MSQAVLLGLEEYQTVYDRLQMRAKGKDNIEVDNVRELAIEWQDQSSTNAKSGYYAKIGNRSLPLTDGAVQTACKMLGVKPKYFNQFQDRNEFPRALYKGIDDGNRDMKGVLVRSDGLRVNAILPRDYAIRDAVDLLDDFMEPLHEHLGDIKGVYSLEEGDGDICSYRVVMGANLLPSIDAKLGQYLMFVLSTSEHGIKPTKTALGLYRSICTNSAIREQELCQWDHRASFGRFHDDTASVIRTAGYFQNAYSRVFQELLAAPLEVPALDLVGAFRESDLITRAHSELARLYVMAPTEDGRECESQYDLFNALTRAARDLPSIQQREVAESKTLKLFSEAGGIREQLRKATESKKQPSTGILDMAE